MGGSKTKLALIVVGAISEPVVEAAGNGDVSGTLRGRAYVYRSDTRGIVCVADIDVRNSPSIDIRYRELATAVDNSNRTEAAEQRLVRDLDVQIRRALAAELRTPASR
ncbi:hypothetical protein AKJ09_05728 [Labilithrix luteola]|uniref:Uncharacterized protein n=1 Tax=Labilithrix luteola TaxID=1391654 RepID=A0A0K1Q0X7_9BACT|nr:hypothetical protein [Labilithrix luteola]AKU99064.1 hypothetical protein AKJ09_05728 [Labilithrix luteola]